jgi:hypothetical protein
MSRFEVLSQGDDPGCVITSDCTRSILQMLRTLNDLSTSTAVEFIAAATNYSSVQTKLQRPHIERGTLEW